MAALTRTHRAALDRDSTSAVTARGMDWSAIEALGITRLVSDSRLVARGDTFVAYPGETSDGRKYIGDAVARGAASVLWEREGFRWSSEWSVKNAPVDDLKRKAGEIASNVYGRPSARLWMVGVTGTNGKTSCSHWIAQALTRAGRRCGVIGTLGSGWPGKLEPLGNTTPDAVLAPGTPARLHPPAHACREHGSVLSWPRTGSPLRSRIRRGRAHEPHARPPRLSRHDARVSQREVATLPLADTQMGRAQRG